MQVAKVLIATLGLGRKEGDRKNEDVVREYEKTVYTINADSQEKNNYETPFIAAALATHLKVDRVFLVGTAKSMWEEVYRYFQSKAELEQDDDYWCDIGEKASKSSSTTPLIQTKDLEKTNRAIDAYLRYICPEAAGGSQCIVIDYGLNEQELWKNFDIIMQIGDSLNHGDEVYLDITHSFRSIPLFMYLMMDFIQTLNYEKEITLAGIYYGMLEAKKEFDNTTPVVDLSPLFKISLWVRGVYDFVNYGNGYLIADLINDENVSPRIKNTSELLNINYLTDLKREIDSLGHYLNKSEASSSHVFKYLMPHLESFIKRFKGINSNSEFQFELAKWYFENKRYSTGYICLAESIITRIEEAYKDAGYRISISSRQREKIKALVNGKFKKSNRQSYRLLSEKYASISQIRNVIAHAGYIEDKNSSKKGRLRVGCFEEDIKECQAYLNSIYKLVFTNNEIKEIPRLYPYDRL